MIRPIFRKTKHKSLNFPVDCQIYPFQIMFSLGETDQQLAKVFKKYGCNFEVIPLVNVTGRAFQYPGNVIVVRTKAIPKTVEEYGTLQHEIFHAVEYIMSIVKIPHDDSTSEAWAYLIGFITKEVYKKL